MKGTQKLSAWRVVENLTDDLDQALVESDWQLVVALANRVLTKALIYVVRKQGLKVHLTWPHLRRQLPKLVPPLKKDYTAVFVESQQIDVKEKYSEDENEEYDADALAKLCSEVFEFISDVRSLAERAGDTS